MRVKKRRRGQKGKDASPGEGWIWGRHAVFAALQNPDRQVTRLIITNEISDLPEKPGVTAERVARDMIESLLPPDAVHQGMAVQTPPLPDKALEDIIDGTAALDRAVVVVLDQVTDPHNVGAVIRSAAVFGAKAVIMQDRHAPPVSGTLAKASSGGIETVPLVRVVNLSRALDMLKEAGFWCLGFDSDESVPLDSVKPEGKLAVVLGAEGPGLRRLTRDSCDRMVRITAEGAFASLNVSNAAAIALYALTRGDTDSDK